jgi:hypothetical protein
LNARSSTPKKKELHQYSRISSTQEISKQASTARSLFSFVDTMSSKTQEKIDRALARAIYASYTPLSITENPYWQEAFKLIRLSYKFPSRHSLTNNLLDAEYSRIMQEVEATCVPLLSDGWTNIRGDSIISLIVCIPQPNFYKSVDTKGQRHTAEYISNLVEKAT